MDSPGHDTDKCWALRHKIQDLIENGTIPVSPPVSQNIDTNPLPTHAVEPSNPTVKMILWKNSLQTRLDSSVPQHHFDRYSASDPFRIDGAASPNP